MVDSKQTTVLQQKWNQRYRDTNGPALPERVLLDFQHLLPPGGVALDLACGLGGNALFLAQHKFETHAWDISDVAIDALGRYARIKNLNLNLQVRDVVQHPPMQNSFDVIVVTHFLERALTKHLIAALKPGGLLFYQTFVQDKVAQVGPGNPQFLLSRNELLQLFGALTILDYRDEGQVGDTGKGCRNESLLVAQKL